MNDSDLKNNYNDIIRENLKNYLGFDITMNFLHNWDFVVFGGAIRDSISNDNINDIDILCAPRAENLFAKLLVDNDYIRLPNHQQGEIAAMYAQLHPIIKLPLTFKKADKIVQLIVPQMGGVIHHYGIKHMSPTDFADSHLMVILYLLLQNVDLSSSGVYYERGVLKESVKGAVNDCVKRQFSIRRDQLMYNADRIEKRTQKLLDKGWKDKNEIDDIDDILDSDEFDKLLTELFED